jgi:UDP-N-acetyl-D-mannosaminuronic acid dehydrogenase
LVEAAPDLTSLIRSARLVNDTQPGYVVELIRRVVGQLDGCHVALLGLAYKPDVDDLRESPAIEIARLLNEAGAVVTAYEPNKTGLKLTGVNIASSLENALREADIIALLVAHSPLMELDPYQVAALAESRVVLDTVNGWPNQSWEAAGFQVYRLGVGRSSTAQFLEKS